MLMRLWRVEARARHCAPCCRYEAARVYEDDMRDDIMPERARMPTPDAARATRRLSSRAYARAQRSGARGEECR